MIAMNYSFRNKWDDIDESRKWYLPHPNIPGQTITPEEWAKEFGKNLENPFQTYYGKLRKEYLSNNHKKISKMTETSLFGTTDSERAMYVVNGHNQESIFQAIGAESEWQKASDIFAGRRNGSAFVWDLETVGNATSPIYDGYAGITEIGINRASFINGELVQGTGKGYSVLLGIDDNQVKALNNLLNRYENEGWKVLNEYEQSTLQRLSMYGFNSIDDVINVQELNFFGRGNFVTINSLLNKNEFNIDQIRRGISNLHTVYEMNTKNGLSPAKLLEKLSRTIIRNHSEDSVIIGANSQYDYDTLIETAKREKAKIDKAGIEAAKISTVDAVYGRRLIGVAENNVVQADVDSVLKEARLPGSQLHHAGKDTDNELNIILSHFRDGDENYADTVLKNIQYLKENEGIKKLSLDDTYFLINRGVLNKNSLDIAVIKAGNETQIAHDYTITNEYWQLGKTGVVNTDNGQKYILELINAADENTTIYKEFDSQSQMMSFLNRDTTWAQGLTEEQILDQKNLGILDKGRRGFDRFFDYGEIRNNNGKIVNGINGINDYLNLTSQLEQIATPAEMAVLKEGNNFAESIGIINKYIGQLEGAKDLLSYRYDVMEYAGMLPRIESEKNLLRLVTDKVTDLMPNADVVKQTIALSQAYNVAKSGMKNNMHFDSVAYSVSPTLSDVFGIDFFIRNANGTYDAARVNAQTVDTATKDLMRIFKNSSKRDILDQFLELNRRSVIDQSMFNRIKRNIQSIKSNESSYSAFTNIAKELTAITKPLSDAANPIDEYMRILTEGYGPTEEGIAMKNWARSLEMANAFVSADTGMYSVAQNLSAVMHQMYKDDKGSVYDVNELLQKYTNTKRGASALNSQMEKTIKTVDSFSNIYFLDSSSAQFDDQISRLANSLGLSGSIKTENSEANLLYSMFDSKYSPVKNKYSMNSKQSEGLQAIVIQETENSNAYVLMSNDKNMTKVIGRLSEGIDGDLGEQFSFSRFKDVKDNFGDVATVLELPKINSIEIDNYGDLIGDDAKLFASSMGEAIRFQTVQQGFDNEKFLMNKLSFYKDSKGMYKAYLNSGAYDLYTFYRQVGADIIDKTLHGEFEKATKRGRQSYDKIMEELSTPSSYGGYEIDGVARRLPNYHPADYLHAYEFRADNLKEMFRALALNEGETPDTPIKIMLGALNKEKFITTASLTESAQVEKAVNSIVDSAYFNEFFYKYLYHGNVAADSIVADALSKRGLSSEGLSFSILNMMYEAAARDTTGTIHESFKHSLQALKTIAPYVNQNVPGTSLEKGVVSLITPGSFNPMAGLYSTMRPIYNQQNRGMYTTYEGIAGAINENTLFGASALDSGEFRIKKILGKAPSGVDYLQQERTLLTSFKHASDLELQGIYSRARNEISDIAQRLNLDENKLLATLDYMEEDLSSVYQDKMLMDPLFGAQEYITRADIKKVSGLKIEARDEDATSRALRKILGKGKLEYGDVIGIAKSGRQVIYKGPAGKFVQSNYDQLMSKDGYTRIIPYKADIRDIKVNINGSEKATAHALDVAQMIMNKPKTFINEQEAMTYAHGLFSELFNGASLVGNPNVIKHNGIPGAHTIFNVITSEYAKADKLDTLVNILNSPDYIDVFRDWNLSVIDNPVYTSSLAGIVPARRLIMNDANANNLYHAVDYLLEQIQNGAISSLGDSEVASVNNRILEKLKYLDENKLSYVTFSRNPQNEHMSNKFRIDQRINQAIRTRNYGNTVYMTEDLRAQMIEEGTLDSKFANAKIKNGILDGYNGRVMKINEFGMETASVNGHEIGKSWDDIEIDELKKQAMKKEAAYKSSSFLNGKYNAIESTMYHNQKELNYNVISEMEMQSKGERSIKGIVELENYLSAPETNVDKNVISVSLDALMENDAIPKSGKVAVSDLEKFFFFIDNKPSQWLSDLAADQNKSFKSAMNSIWLDFDGREIPWYRDGADNPIMLKGIYLPIQNVMSGIDGDEDTAIFMRQQTHIANFLNDFIEALHNPKKSSEITSIINNYRDNMVSQLAILNKDSDAYKIYGRFLTTNSGQLLAQDEAAPIVEGMVEELMPLIEEQEKLERQLMSGATNEEIRSLDDIYRKQQDILDKYAAQVLDDTIDAPMISGIKNKIIQDNIIATINGKQYYDFIGAASREVFIDKGISFSAIGMDIINELTASEITIPGFSNYDEILDFIGGENAIAEIVSEMKTIGYKPRSTNNIKASIDNLFTFINQEGKDYMLDIRSLNNAIAEGGNLNKAYKLFSDIGEKYLTQKGMLAIYNRYPSFGGQPDMKVFLDPTMEGKQFRLANPITSISTHVDFDGDTNFLKFLASGYTTLRTNNPLYVASEMSRRTSIMSSRKLLSELIADGDSVFSLNPNDYEGQAANMLKSFHKDRWDEAVLEWGKNRGVNITDIDDLSKATIFAASHSPEMRNAVRAHVQNTMLDETVKVASMINLRKAYIGIISNPSFILRETAERLYRNAPESVSGGLNRMTKADVRRRIINLTNMSTSEGGFTRLLEQKGIDVKHVIDAFSIADTPQYALGLKRMFTRYANMEAHKAKAIKKSGLLGIMQAANKVTYNVSNDKLESYAERIMSTSFDDLEQKAINLAKQLSEAQSTNGIATKTILKDLNTAKFDLYFKSILDISEIDNASEIYNLQIYQAKGTIDNSIGNTLEQLNKMSNIDMIDSLYGTAMFPFARTYREAQSDAQLLFEKNKFYISPGYLSGEVISDNTTNLIDKGIVYTGQINGGHSFSVVNMNTPFNEDGSLRIINSFKITPTKGAHGSKNNSSINRQFLEHFGVNNFDDIISVNIQDYRGADKAISEITDSNIKREKFVKSLNRLTLEKDGTVRRKMADVFKKMNSHEDYKMLFGDKRVFHLLQDIFPNTEVISKTAKAMDIYDYAYKTGQISSKSTSGELIRQINRDIAENPGRYVTPDIRYMTYDEIVLKRLNEADIFNGDNEFFKRLEADMQTMNGFNTTNFHSTLSGLDMKLFDIEGDKMRLDAAYDIIQNHLDTYKALPNAGSIDVKQLEDILTDRNATISSLIDSIDKANKATIDSAQKQVYKMFGDNYQTQMKKAFGWEAVSGTSKVGFGNYLGVKFHDLSMADIDSIKKASKVSQDVLNLMSDREKFAMTETINALNAYNPKSYATANARKALKSSIDIDNHIEGLEKALKAVHEANYEKVKDAVNTFAETTAKEAKKRTVPNSLWQSAKDFAANNNINKKTIGTVAGALAAIGVVNSLLHRDKNKSPLSPANSNLKEPYVDGGTPVAPGSTQVIYTDKNTGFNFKVSARTRNYISDMQNAQLIQRSGGGSSSMYSYNDNSRVTDNWLANKFAELSE